MFPFRPSSFFNPDDYFGHRTLTISVLEWWSRPVALNVTVFSVVFWENVTVIIDGFEVFINRPLSLWWARAQTFSSYVKGLIGITPRGSISFVSKAWGGRTSEKFLTENCGFFKEYTTRRFGFNRSWFNYTKVLCSIRPNWLFQHSQEEKNSLTH